MIATETRLAPEEVLSPEEPEVHHFFCEPAPRNNPVVTVMCCGTPDGKAGQTRGILPGDIPCPICYDLDEHPEVLCACWQVATG